MRDYHHFVYLGDTALRVNKIVSISGVGKSTKINIALL